MKSKVNLNLHGTSNSYYLLLPTLFRTDAKLFRVSAYSAYYNVNTYNGYNLLPTYPVI